MIESDGTALKHSGGQVDAFEVARIRQGTYRLLAAGFGRPSSQLTESVAVGAEALAELDVAGFAFIDPVFGWVGRLVEADASALAAEHVRLFGAGMDGALCSLVESQRLGSNLHGDPARYSARIEDLVVRSGLERVGTVLPPDHLVVQLESISAWCEREAAAWEAGTDPGRWIALQEELVGSLDVWIRGLAADVALKDRSGVFAALAGATAAVVDHDGNLVRMLARQVGVVR